MNKLLIFFALILLVGCKKDIVLTKEQITTIGLNNCFNEKEFPNLPRGEAYIEGEFNGRAFSFSKSNELAIFNSVSVLKSTGYQTDYAKSWAGPGFTVAPTDAYRYSVSNAFNLDVRYQRFMGDSTAFMKYFDQFQKGKTFRFVKELSSGQTLEPEVVRISFTAYGCNGESTSATSNIFKSDDADQTNSFFRVADVKEYKNAAGQVEKRDVTIEFETNLGKNELIKIRKGRIFFSF